MLAQICKPLYKPFPFFLESDRKNIVLSTAIAVFIFLFLVTFRPWEEELQKTIFDYFIYSIIPWFVLLSAIVILPKLIPGIYNTERWNFARYLGLCLLKIVTITLGIFVYNTMVCSAGFTMAEITGIFYKTLSLSIIVCAFMAFFINYKQLRKSLSGQKNGTETEELVADLFTIHAETKETLSLEISKLLYAQAQDNYTEIFWCENDEMKSHLLRLSLKNLEDQINRPEIVRCHRSYMVNLERIKSFSGNSNGWKLTLEHVENSIPVSRGFVKFIEPHLTRLAIHPN